MQSSLQNFTTITQKGNKMRYTFPSLFACLSQLCNQILCLPEREVLIPEDPHVAGMNWALNWSNE